jgi:hypothetical protein
LETNTRSAVPADMPNGTPLLAWSMRTSWMSPGTPMLRAKLPEAASMSGTGAPG